MKMKTHRTRALALFITLTLTAVGCAGRPALIPNPDKNLRKTSAEFAADAAKRHPFKADLPSGGDAEARAQVGYSLNRLEVVNLSKDSWSDVEIWANRSYVVHLPVMEPNKLKIINFEMLFNDKGHTFPTDNKKVLVNQVEMVRDGKVYNVKVQQAD